MDESPDMPENLECTLPVTLLMWQWAKIGRISQELGQSPDSLIEEFVCWGLDAVVDAERDRSVDDAIRLSGAKPPDNDPDDEEGGSTGLQGLINDLLLGI